MYLIPAAIRWIFERLFLINTVGGSCTLYSMWQYTLEIFNSCHIEKMLSLAPLPLDFLFSTDHFLLVVKRTYRFVFHLFNKTEKILYTIKGQCHEICVCQTLRWMILVTCMGSIFSRNDTFFNFKIPLLSTPIWSGRPWGGGAVGGGWWTLGKNYLLCSKNYLLTFMYIFCQQFLQFGS